MNLSNQQHRALENGDIVPISEGGIDCVIVRADVFAQIQGAAYDASEWTEGEMRIIAERTLDDADATGPNS